MQDNAFAVIFLGVLTATYLAPFAPEASALIYLGVAAFCLCVFAIGIVRMVSLR